MTPPFATAYARSMDCAPSFHRPQRACDVFILPFSRFVGNRFDAPAAIPNVIRSFTIAEDQMAGYLKTLRITLCAAALLACCCPSVALPAGPGGLNRWTAIGPDGANVVALAIDPRTPSTAYAGTMGSGVLKSTDRGASWMTANAALPSAHVLALAIDPSAPSTLFAGTDMGIFKSTDGGTSWAAANGGLPGAERIWVTSLAIDPASPGAVYASTSRGVFKTVDGGASWKPVNDGLPGLPTSFIVLDPVSTSTIYVAVADVCGPTSVFKSTDAGTSWKRIYTSPYDSDCGYSIMAIAIDPRSPSRLYLAVSYGGVVTSLDGGASWSEAAALGICCAPPEYGFTSLAIDPASPARLYAGTYSGAVLRSTDAGVHWMPVSDRPLAADSVNVITMSASDPETLYVGASVGVYRSSDRGDTWRHLTLGVRNLGTSPLAVDPSAPSTIYTAVRSVVMKTTDGGIHWDETPLDDPDTWVFSLVIDPASPSTVYSGTSSGVYKTTDGGIHWALASKGLPRSGLVQALAIAPSRSSTLYAGVAFAGVLKTVDGGSSWTQVNRGVTAVGIYVSQLAVDPTNPDIVYLATPPTGRPDTDAKLFKSTNGAAEWRQVAIALPAGVVITSLVIDPATPSTIYAAYYDYLSLGGGVYKSSDSGETWTAAQDGLGGMGVGALAIDPSSTARIYAATRAGVFMSSDAASWTPINSGLPSLGVGALSIDRSGSFLRASTAAGLFEYQVSDAPGAAPLSNFTGLWWKSPAGSESGWGIAVDHQGPIVFAAWLTYDHDRRPTWFVMPRAEVSPLSDPNRAEPRENTYAGPLYKPRATATQGPEVFPRPVTLEQFGFGNGGFHFQPEGDSVFWYPRVNHEIDGPIEKSITPFQFSSAVTACVENGTVGPSPNYQGFWWNSPAGSESGWGLYLAHQGDVIFAILLTYDFEGSPWWYSIILRKGIEGHYAGRIYWSSGPDYDEPAFNPANVGVYEAGAATLRFSDHNNGVFTAELFSLDFEFYFPLEAKNITRMIFSAVPTVCN
jgi:photosystem II stability/assembly factor-like uncharacterized protein